MLSAVLSQLSAAIADTAAADGNLRGLNHWFTGPRPYLISGAGAIALAATVPTLTIVAIASRAFAAYYAIQALIALRTTTGLTRKLGFGTPCSRHARRDPVRPTRELTTIPLSDPLPVNEFELRALGDLASRNACDLRAG